MPSGSGLPTSVSIKNQSTGEYITNDLATLVSTYDASTCLFNLKSLTDGQSQSGYIQNANNKEYLGAAFIGPVPVDFSPAYTPNEGIGLELQLWDFFPKEGIAPNEYLLFNVGTLLYLIVSNSKLVFYAGSLPSSSVFIIEGR